MNPMKTSHFYLLKKRLYSADGNLNWRLQIWQDVAKDLNTSPVLRYFGYGYKNIIPAMDMNHVKVME